MKYSFKAHSKTGCWSTLKECEPQISKGKKLEVLDTVDFVTRNFCILPVCHQPRILKNTQNPDTGDQRTGLADRATTLQLSIDGFLEAKQAWRGSKSEDPNLIKSRGGTLTAY